MQLLRVADAKLLNFYKIIQKMHDPMGYSISHIYSSYSDISSGLLTLSWWRPISYRNQSIDLLSKSVDWFLYDIGLRHERVKATLLTILKIQIFKQQNFRAKKMSRWSRKELRGSLRKKSIALNDAQGWIN